jgi:epoxyqueuosine reductase
MVADKDPIRVKGRELGFDEVGFAPIEADPADRHNLATYLGEGRHGDMAWMETTADRRANPLALWPEARSIIVVGMNYGPSGDPMEQLEHHDRGAISVYARGRDYHLVMKKRLKAFGRWVSETHHCDVKVFVDTAPVMEKPIAMRAGLGWIGKHTNLVSRRFGSWLFLGEVFTTLDLPPDAPELDHCGSCDRCLRACPTGALPEPYRIEPRRCISYLTIEHKGPVDEDLKSAMGNRIYGCDDCLAVCPWNSFATPSPHEELLSRGGHVGSRLADLAELDEPDFRTLFSGSAVKRTGRDRFVRNVMVASGNSGDPGLAGTVSKRLSDPSALVRDAAHWASNRLKVESS